MYYPLYLFTTHSNLEKLGDITPEEFAEMVVSGKSLNSNFHLIILDDKISQDGKIKESKKEEDSSESSKKRKHEIEDSLNGKSLCTIFILRYENHTGSIFIRYDFRTIFPFFILTPF